MTARFNRAWAKASRANLAASVSLLLTASASQSSAASATPAQRRYATPEVYRFCAGKIANVRAIASLLRRQKASLRAAVYKS